MSDEENWKSGGCLCGAVRYAIDRGSVAGESHCHCRDCQRATGSAFATFCFVPDTGFRSEAGEAKGYTVGGSSGQGVSRYFCADCGSQLYSEVGVMPGVKFVKAGSLDDASWMSPQSAFWCDTAQPWITMPEGVTEIAKNPE
jgi:hypothetical protein